MSAQWLRVIAGKMPLPDDMLERSKLLNYADGHHVLGQMATVWLNEATGKTHDVMENALYRARFDHNMLQFEINRLQRALLGSDIKAVLLKGGAYVASDLKAGRGRRVSDLDILVVEADIKKTEKLLLEAEWAFDETTANPYDQQYYRENMHELPPLRHTKRRTILDVHHCLLPKTARVKIRSELFFDTIKPFANTGLYTFDELDTFIHSAIHSFADGSFDTPARSVLELWYLLQDIPETKDEALWHRAQATGAEKPVSYALWAVGAFLDEERANALLTRSSVKLSVLVRWCFRQKLEKPDQAYFAKLVLYIRSHYMRMPMGKLVGHLAVKLFRRLKGLIDQQDQTKT
ncbi:nucleotidyltransferase family protein [Kordiimonas pumila]|uniref:Nucleotidyltransferase family protein n=1 Tax=Kordiimonas pumila TaxID=2161677 RepID=A0ABV7D231_9PROT|nr:nucleotidyltransferase family protein [Kordiimonas pumila]